MADHSDQSYVPTDRRPIATRSWPIWVRAAKSLAQRGVSPNGISLAGMGFGVAAGAALAATTYASGFERVAWLAGAVFIQLRLLANLLDGMVAIESGRASPLGELYNEVPDRVSDTATLIGAGLAVGGESTLGYLAACVAMFTAYVRATGKAAGVAQEFCGPMAKQQRMALLTAIAVYCGVAPLAWQPAWQPGWSNAKFGLASAALLVIVSGGLLTAMRRLLRIAANLKNKRSEP